MRQTWPHTVGINNSTVVIADHLYIQRITIFLAPIQITIPKWSVFQNKQRTVDNTNTLLENVFDLYPLLHYPPPLGQNFTFIINPFKRVLES